MTRSTSEWNFHFLLVSEVSATQIRQRSKVPVLANIFFLKFIYLLFFYGWLLQNLWITLDTCIIVIPLVNPLAPRSNCHSPYCQSYNSYSVNLENLVLGQLITPKLKFFFIRITYLVDKLY